ncbi:MAG: hypothetical protein Q8Q04_01650 [archaeon]|nr:hypothetical protein [archaeon]
MRKLSLTTLAALLLANPNLEVGNTENDFKKIPNSGLKNPEEALLNSSFSTYYLSKFNLSNNFNFEQNKELNIKLPPRSLLNLDGELINLSPTVVTSVTYPPESPISFSKFAYVFNETDRISNVKIFLDSNSVLNITTDFSKVRNGPFLASPNEDKIEVSSFYGTNNVLPMKVFTGKNKGEVITFIDEKNYPPYFISERLAKKDSITNKDITGILNSYSNLYGDYFRVNHKSLVCTDAATLILKTAGINFKNELEKVNIRGGSYLERNITSIMRLLEKNNLSDYVYTFKEGKLENVLKDCTYENLTPKNFGMQEFSPGQILIFSRFYNSGPKKGKIQKTIVHMGVIYDTDGQKVKEISSVSSHSSTPPYDKNIMMGVTDFEKWYEIRSNYTGSDETNESLTYRVYKILDLPKAINEIKKSYVGKR